MLLGCCQACILKRLGTPLCPPLSRGARQQLRPDREFLVHGLLLHDITTPSMPHDFDGAPWTYLTHALAACAPGLAHHGCFL